MCVFAFGGAGGITRIYCVLLSECNGAEYRMLILGVVYLVRFTHSVNLRTFSGSHPSALTKK